VTSDDIYDGVSYDARLEQDGWAQCGFEPSQSWHPVRAIRRNTSAHHLDLHAGTQFDSGSRRARVAFGTGMRHVHSDLGPAGVAPRSGTYSEPEPALDAELFASHIPIRPVRQYSPIGAWQAPSGSTGGTGWVFDFGQNMAGVVRFTVEGQRGQVVTIRHAEILNPDGSGSIDNLFSGAAMKVTYTLRGDKGPETYVPQFTYMGFRYIEVTGWPGVPDEAAFTALFSHSALEPTGALTSSDGVINRI